MGRRFDQILGVWLPALAVALLFLALLGVSAPALSQGTGASDAEAIAKARDLAAKKLDAEAKQGTTTKPAAGKAKAAGPADASAEAGAAGDVEAEKEVELPENEKLPLGSGESGLFDSASADRSGGGGMGDGWLMSTLAALGVVLAIVFALRWALRRGGVVSISAPQGSVVEVLSRTTVAPRSHVVLMRVGQRILVVSDSSAGMRTLASVDDPEEFAELLGAVDAGKATSISKSFSGVMKKLGGQWSAADDIEQGAGGAPQASADGVGMDRTRNALASVRGRLAALSGAGGKP